MVRVRFAPSPTGIPHIGNTRTTLYNYLFARKNQGKFIVRVEDTDQERLVPGSLEKILEILEFLGMHWDEGPYIQSERLNIYQEHAEKLIASNHAYYCFCTKQRLEKLRNKQQAQGIAVTRYNRHCRTLAKEEVEAKLKANTPYVIRLKVPDSGKISWVDAIQGKIEFDLETIDDQVLLKSDGFPTYHLGVVVDDHLMNISHVLRGVEWISSTPKQILLFEAFGWTLPIFGHLPIVLGPNKSKLSKRHGAKSALDYRDAGYLPEALISFMAYLGWSYQDNSQLLTLKELTQHFDLAKVQKSNPIFDIQKLNYFNGKAIRAKSDQELLSLVKPYVEYKASDKKLLEIIPLIKERITTLKDVNNLIGFFFTAPSIPDELVKYKQYLADIHNTLSKVDWEKTAIESALLRLVSDKQYHKGDFFMSLRLAVCGQRVTPPLTESMLILGKAEVISRLHHAQKIL